MAEGVIAAIPFESNLQHGFPAQRQQLEAYRTAPASDKEAT